MELKPLDVIVLSSKTAYPMYKKLTHMLINWRSFEDAVHCLTVINSDGMCWSPEFTGIKCRHISEYNGYTASIHRYKLPFSENTLVAWCGNKVSHSKGYDFWRQWVLGSIFGMYIKSISNDESRWTCSELPYWAFQENGYELTRKEEVVPLPRLFRYHSNFEEVFNGILGPE